jgi:hypothetical protein
MAKSLLFAESKPSSPDLVEEYHRWHDQVHAPEMLAKPVAVETEPPPITRYLSLSTNWLASTS